MLSQTARLPFDELPFAHLRAENADQVEEEYRKIQFVNWVDEKVFDGEIPRDTVKFWAGVLKHETSTGKKPFKNVAEYALSCLSLPVSNAVAERVFSYVTCIKTKQHNRMQLKALELIVRI